MPNFSSLARLEVPEKFLWVGWVVQSHCIVKPNLVVRLGWGFDNVKDKVKAKAHKTSLHTKEILGDL